MLVLSLFEFGIPVSAAQTETSGSSAATLRSAGDAPLPFTWSGMRIPKWSNGALIVVRDGTTLHPSVWINEGQQTYSLPFAVSGAASLLIYDWDRGQDGTVGLSGSGTDSEGRLSGFVAWISRDGQSSKVIQTGLYRPARVAVDARGDLWCAGSEPIKLDSPILKPEGGIVRHFGRSGEILGSFVLQATVNDPIHLYVPENQFRAAKDRVIWYSPAEGRYIEISLRGEILADFSIPSPDGARITGLAITDRGEVFASGEGHVFMGVYILDRSTRQWRSALQRTITPKLPSTDDFYALYGADGNMLVLHGYGRIKRFDTRN